MKLRDVLLSLNVSHVDTPDNSNVEVKSYSINREFAPVFYTIEYNGNRSIKIPVHTCHQNWLLWYNKQPTQFCKIQYRPYPLLVRFRRKLYLFGESMQQKLGLRKHPHFFPWLWAKVISFFS